MLIYIINNFSYIILVSYSPPFNIPSSAELNGYRYQTVFHISIFHITYADNAHTNRAGHQLHFTKGEISKRPVLFTGDY